MNITKLFAILLLPAVLGKFELHKAVWDKTLTTQTHLLRRDNINEQDEAGNTALHLAAGLGNPVETMLLLENEADVRIRNNEGWSPFELANLNGNYLEARFIGKHLFVEPKFNGTVEMGRVVMELPIFSINMEVIKTDGNQQQQNIAHIYVSKREFTMRSHFSLYNFNINPIDLWILLVPHVYNVWNYFVLIPSIRFYVEKLNSVVSYNYLPDYVDKLLKSPVHKNKMLMENAQIITYSDNTYKYKITGLKYEKITRWGYKNRRDSLATSWEKYKQTHEFGRKSNAETEVTEYEAHVTINPAIMVDFASLLPHLDYIIRNDVLVEVFKFIKQHKTDGLPVDVVLKEVTPGQAPKEVLRVKLNNYHAGNGQTPADVFEIPNDFNLIGQEQGRQIN